MKKNQIPMSLAMGVADFAANSVALALGTLLVEPFSPGLFADALLPSIVVLPCLAIVYIGARLYPPAGMRPAEELRKVALGNGLVFFVLASVSLWQGRGFAFAVSIAASFLLSVLNVQIARYFVRTAFGGRDWWGIRVAVIGTGVAGKTIADRLMGQPRFGLKPALMVRTGEGAKGEYRGIPIVEGGGEGEEAGISRAILALPDLRPERVRDAINVSLTRYRRLMIVPDLFGVPSLWARARDLDGVLAVETTQMLRIWYIQALKRAMDLFIVVIGGLIVSPLLLCIALLVKLSSRGKIFYAQPRIGKNGKAFKAWKFRSMVENADALLERHLAENAAAREEWEKNFKLKDDPRITKLGKFLRSTSLDEFPQIWNVLRNEMSLVGPRPIVREEIERYGEAYALFSSVKPGMTGFWQISGRSDTSYANRVELDAYYVRNWSIWLDIYILMRTFLVVFGKRGAY